MFSLNTSFSVDIHRLLTLTAVLAVSVAVLATLYFPSRPSAPPSESARLLRRRLDDRRTLLLAAAAAASVPSSPRARLSGRGSGGLASSASVGYLGGSTIPSGSDYGTLAGGRDSSASVLSGFSDYDHAKSDQLGCCEQVIRSGRSTIISCVDLLSDACSMLARPAMFLSVVAFSLQMGAYGTWSGMLSTFLETRNITNATTGGNSGGSSGGGSGGSGGGGLVLSSSDVGMLGAVNTFGSCLGGLVAGSCAHYMVRHSSDGERTYCFLNLFLSFFYQ